MIYLLCTAIVVDVLAIWSARGIGSGDNFGAAYLALICGALGGILTIVYIALVFWNHRFI